MIDAPKASNNRFETAGNAETDVIDFVRAMAPPAPPAESSNDKLRTTTAPSAKAAARIDSLDCGSLDPYAKVVGLSTLRGSDALLLALETQIGKSKEGKQAPQEGKPESTSFFKDSSPPLDARARPDSRAHRNNPTDVTSRSQATFEKTASGLLHRLDTTVTDRVAALKNYINANGRDATDALVQSASDPSKVTFFGEEHTINSPSRTLLCKALEKAPSSAIFTPEFPSALKPLFDRYNASPKDTKFTLPDDLDELVGKKAATFCRFNEEILGSASVFEAAHRNGIKIRPIDDPRTMDVFDGIPLDVLMNKVDPNDPRVARAADDMFRHVLDFTRGGSKNPEREETMAANLLAVTKEFPDSPVIAQVGRTHAAEHTPAELPVSKRLAANPEFIKSGKDVVSFGIFEGNSNLAEHSLSSFARELDRPVSFPTTVKGLDKKGSNPLDRLDSYRNIEMDRFTAYDHVILMNDMTKAANQTNKPAGNGSFLTRTVNSDQTRAIGSLLPVGSKISDEMTDVLSRNDITGGDIGRLQLAINKEGQDPVKMIREATANPRSLLLIDDRSPSSSFAMEDGKKSLEASVAESLAKSMRELPPGSVLAVDIPLVFAPFIEEFNKSPKGTSFKTVYENPEYKKLMKNEDTAEMMLASDVFNNDKLQVYEAAHDRGISIVPFGTNKDLHRVHADKIAHTIQTTNLDHAKAIQDIALKNPNAPIVVWSNRTSGATEIENNLSTNSHFSALNREVTKIGIVGRSFDTVMPLCSALSKPVGLDLRNGNLDDLGSRCLASVPVAADTSYDLATRLLRETMKNRYDKVIMYPANDK